MSFKVEILEMLIHLDVNRLQELEAILLEVEKWQEDFLKKKIISDPDFYHKITEAKRNTTRTTLDFYKQNFKKEDHTKLQIILNKIKSL
jgi:hypothetical protein